ncbi:aminodeoxychorismate synthase component I [Paenibacillus xylaniclasticus]|uniref:aminodeoxychorismate synthase component I n=1 Tax=Paenibacillus xylaniclasticus TaxID=588083 RepID=UPI000FD84E43|nr:MULTISPECIES: aminodeoxychorismate synthase component I [Paenibacillus]GFN32194.1 aminodeoxychorismate synthase, component I [Paenibacillus curdlanolyticus]
MKTLIIDNYDSYTYNLFQMVAVINGEEPTVVYNNAYDWNQLKREIPFDNIIISPGPGSADVPADFGICSQALMEDDIPILGVCLGHQGMGHIHGAQIIHSPEVMHGKISRVYHNGDELFADIPESFSVVRYHSLLLANPLPSQLRAIAWTGDGLNMGIRRVNKPHWGVQFHPESIASEYGATILKNFHRLSAASKLYSIPRAQGLQETRGSERVRAGKSDKAGQASYQVMSRRLTDYLDPAQVFGSLFAGASHSFWLDSNRSDGNMSRFSFMGDTTGPLSFTVYYDADKRCVTEEKGSQRKKLNMDIFQYLDEKLAQFAWQSPELPFDFNTGFVGYFGYETRGRLTEHPAPANGEPDAMFMFADRLIVFDSLEQQMYLLCLTEYAEEAQGWFEEIERRLAHLDDFVIPQAYIEEPITFNLHQSYEKYKERIQEVKRCLIDGESYEINLTNSISTELEVNPLSLYLNLRIINPAPYSAFIRANDLHILCSSPERFVKIDTEGNIEAKPIKGTIARGSTPLEDEQMKERLRTSGKDFSENLMVVDLLRNDLGMVCEVGSVHVPKLMEIETFETVHQLVSTVRGKRKSTATLNECIKAVFPGGSMTGAPKKRSMEIIERLEERRRGIYSGAIGFLGVNNAADLNIVIRTIVQQGNQLTLGVGGAIVIDSDPDQEFDEILLKANALLRAITYTAKGNSWSEQYTINGGREHKPLSLPVAE